MQRHLPFEKAINFRDMGGYETADGAKVKWKRLFRCGHLGMLTDTDLERLAALDPAIICDFRSSREYEKTPARTSPLVKAVTHQLDIWPKVGNPFADNVNDFASGVLTAAEFFDLQRETYRQFVTRFSDRYAAMFRLMEQAEGRPMVIHCTAGKDRTGFGAALILHTLGVPDEVIRDDYMLSNRCPFMLSFARYVIGKGVKWFDPGWTEDTKLEKLMVLFGANLDLLDVAFAAVREQAGSVDAYLRDVLGVTDEKRAKLRDWLLE